jgi:O-antigen/teichoic acid export membrane protein/thymidylate kinase
VAPASTLPTPAPADATESVRAEPIRALSAATWAVADQVLISATNFATTVLLARELSQAAFGRFALIYLALLFVNSLQGGLITQPHNILGPRRRGADYARYTASTAVCQLALIGIAALIALIAWAVAEVVRSEAAPLLLALLPAIVAWQVQEFVRRVLYTERRLVAAFTVDLVGYGGQGVAIALLWYFNVLTGPRALFALAAAFVLGALIGGWLVRGSLTGPVDRAIILENWHFGKWLAGGQILSNWLSTELFVFLCAGMLGAAAVGVLRAVNTIFGPTRILAYVLNTLLPIDFSRTLAVEGETAFQRQFRRACLVAFPLLGGYCLCIALFAGPLLWLIYGSRYAEYASVLRFYAIFTFISYIAIIIATALKAKERTFELFSGQLITCVVSIPVGWILILFLGIHGAVLAMMITSVGLSVLYWREYLAAARRWDANQSSREGAGLRSTNGRHHRLPVTPSNTGSGKILANVFAVLDEGGIAYCVTHGYEAFPQTVKSDVDCVVAADVLPTKIGRLLHEKRREIGADLVRYRSDHIVLTHCNPDGVRCYLELDLSPHYELYDRGFYAGDEVLMGRRRYRDFWIPAPEMEFGCYLVRKIAKGDLNDEHARRLSELYKENPVGCAEQVNRFWVADSSALLLGAARSGNWQTVIGQVARLRAELLRRAVLHHPVRTACNWLRRNASRVRHVLRPDGGLNVVFLGPDGAGKSSLIQGLRRELAPAFAGTATHSFPPALLRRVLGRPEGPERPPHASPPRSMPASVIRALGYWLLYYTVGYYFGVRLALARSTLILHDRHLLDALVDPKRYRYAGPAWLLRLIWRLVPKPDVIFLLDAPPGVIQARKQDVPIGETARQRRAYLALLGTVHNGHVIDAAQPQDQVLREVRDLLLAQRNRCIARSLGCGKERYDVTHPEAVAVTRALEQLVPECPPHGWRIERLDEGAQAGIFSVERVDGREARPGYREVVVKVYKPAALQGGKAVPEQFELLRRLHARFDGRVVNGWKIHSPAPIYRCENPVALVMTRVPGRSLNSCLTTPASLMPEALDSLAETIIGVLQREWWAHAQVYGDLNFDNVLCDLANGSISFVDPGIAEDTAFRDAATLHAGPASRDLGYLLYDTTVSLKRTLARPGTRRRQQYLLERMLRTALGAIEARPAQQAFVGEVRACAQSHLRRLSGSWSPRGIWHFLLRRIASRRIEKIVAKLSQGVINHPQPVGPRLEPGVKIHD